MQIFSFHGGAISKDTSDRVLELVRKTSGPIVLPLKFSEMPSIRVDSRNEERVRKIRSVSHALLWQWIAVLAVAEGKEILPLFMSVDTRLKREERAAWERLEGQGLHHPNRARVEAMKKRSMYRYEAKRVQAMYNRLKEKKPVLVVAEDTYARLLGRLARVKVHRLTRDDPITRRIVRESMREIELPWMTRPKPPRRRKRGRK